MTNGIAFAIGVGVGFVASVLVVVWRARSVDRRRPGLRRALVSLAFWLVLPVCVAAFMPTFRAAVLVLLGNGVGGALSQPVTLLLSHKRVRVTPKN
jgi:hypothetical protein